MLKAVADFLFPTQRVNITQAFKFRAFCKMCDENLQSLPTVDIEEGAFKYVLIKASGKQNADGSREQKTIVRGYADCQWHTDIFERVNKIAQEMGLEVEALGGGKIEHKPDAKYIKVHGASQGYGKADHEEAKNILLAKYPDYQIEIVD